MKKLLSISVLLMGVFSFGTPQPQSSTYDTVVRGMSCRQNMLDDLECEYRVGQSLHFTIAGVGEKDAGIVFNSSSFDGDYYAGFGILHGCVIVKPGKPHSKEPDIAKLTDIAFVSPRTGKVYTSWEACGKAK